MRALIIFVVAISFSACSLVYRLPTRQGNVLEQKQLDQLKVGQTRDQVKFLLGTPLAASTFRPDRWDYVGYYKSPRGDSSKRTISLFFAADGKLARMEGIQMANASAALNNPDIDSVLRDQKKAQLEDERAAGQQEPEGLIMQPTGPDENSPQSLPNP